jgi:hypothetical protein
MQYEDHHLELMQRLDTFDIPVRVTQQWLWRAYGTNELHMLTEEQALTLAEVLKGNRQEVRNAVYKQAGAGPDGPATEADV